MKELLEFAFSGVNIIPTCLFIFVLVYWLIVILGVLDIDSVDVDVDLDVNGFASVLAFFNLDQLPLMIFLTFYVIPLWVVTLIGNDLLGFNSFLTGLIVFTPSMIVCLFVAKFLTIPFALFFKKIKSETEAVENIVGSICVAKLPITADRKSQAEINVGGTSILINVKTKEGLVIEKGQTALVIDHVQSGNFYYVEPY
ncbi:OB-fold-containig protein [Marinoscillum pacificum]|uniref:OB-fold-containig protein n=1 Tax=Marinoscillum pacificum TaxID=392723 RepID=UPI0021571347|nr:OB-fold-containig protein [Marinoscillum pacificum]